MTDRISTIAELEALYGETNANSLAKETPVLTTEYRHLIEASPFVSIATIGEGGMDCSPRGDTAPVVHVLDESPLALPYLRGNNRLDTLKNIVPDPRIRIRQHIRMPAEHFRIEHIANDLEPRPGCILRLGQSIYIRLS
mgnify:CR=1 FL=1